jgi:predicted O-methyltransferase YrrM
MRSTRRWAILAAVLLLAAGGGLAWSRAGANADPRVSLAGLPETPALQVIRAMGHGHGVTAAEGRHMHDLIVARGYKRGLDVGTAHGYSALWFGMAVAPAGGSVVTIEIDAATAETARAHFRRAALTSVVDSRVNDAFLEIPRLEGDFDFVFFDTGLDQDQRFLDLLRGRIRPGGAVMAHNATFMRWQQPEFWKSIHDPEYETSVFGRVAVALKRGGSPRSR